MLIVKVSLKSATFVIQYNTTARHSEISRTRRPNLCRIVQTLSGKQAQARLCDVVVTRGVFEPSIDRVRSNKIDIFLWVTIDSRVKRVKNNGRNASNPTALVWQYS